MTETKRLILGWAGTLVTILTSLLFAIVGDIGSPVTAWFFFASFIIGFLGSFFFLAMVVVSWEALSE